MSQLRALWFGFSQQVDRRRYALWGFLLMILKYLGEAVAVWLATSTIYSPLNFLSPAATLRLAPFEGGAPSPFIIFNVIWSLPFLWVAVSMSVRRAIDAGYSPWVGMAVLVPLLNYLVMLGLAIAPSSQRGPKGEGTPRTLTQQGQYTLRAILVGVAFGALTVGIAVLIASAGASSYSALLFLGIPTVVGTVSSFIYHQGPNPSPRGGVKLSLTTVHVAGLVLLLFALEGLLCVVMALPFSLLGGVLGGYLGAMIARHCPTTSLSMHTGGAVLFLVVGLATSELVPPVEERVVVSRIEVAAPIGVVWRNVIAFPELPPPTELLFRTGIAYPIGARIEGSGVGAVRYCEFSTGPFVEPITAWEPPTRLAFDVTERPAAMVETALWGEAHPAHLRTIPESRRGEFRLIPLGADRTLVEGRTWYVLRIGPESYWALWSDWIIGQIHARVLDHIRRVSEASS